MRTKILQKQIIPMKNSFKKELFTTLLNLDLPKYPNNTGNKQFTTFQRLALVILYHRSKVSLRNFCEQINNESLWKRDLKLEYNLRKSTLNDWCRNFDLEFLKKILDETNRGDTPKILGIDGSGLSSLYKSSYYQKRLKDFGISPKSPYHKLDVIVDLENKKKIYDFTFTIKQYNDKKQARRLFNRFKFSNIFMIGDRGYYYYYLFNKMKEQNNIFIVPPIKIGAKTKHNAVIRREFQNTYKKYKELYSKRNNVEGVFSALKRTILSKIVSKNHMTKKREVAFKLIIYNLQKNIFCAFFNLRKNSLFC
jgi:hypothetical protein